MLRPPDVSSSFSIVWFSSSSDTTSSTISAASFSDCSSALKNGLFLKSDLFKIPFSLTASPLSVDFDDDFDEELEEELDDELLNQVKSKIASFHNYKLGCF